MTVINDLAFSSDGRYLATATYWGSARVWDAATGLGVSPPLYHHAQLWAVAFSPDGTLLATGDRADQVRVWDVETGRQVMDPLPHAANVSSVTFSPDGRWLATGSCRGTPELQLWDVATGQRHGPPIEGGSYKKTVAFSPDGALISGVTGSTVQLWNVSTRRPYGPPLSHDEAVLSVAFSPDGSLLATASTDGWARFWTVGTADSRRAAVAHGGTAREVAFSPNGQLLATASDDHTARLWDVTTGQPVGPPIECEGVVNAVAFSPDGRSLALGISGVTGVKVWKVVSDFTDERVMEDRTSIALGARLDAQGFIVVSQPGELNASPAVHAAGQRRHQGVADVSVLPNPIFDLLAMEGGKLYAGGSDGVIRSVDGGVSWAHSDLAGASVISLAAYDSAIFAVTDGPMAVMRTPGAGANWEPVGPQAYANSIEAIGDELYRGEYWGPVYRKRRGEDEWDQVGRRLWGRVSSFSEADSHLYASWTGAGIWRWDSSDWVETHTGAGEASLTMPGSYVNAGDALVGHPDFDWRVVPM
ncbi:MAG: WD40 repeat domain-containing protein, partial [Candidatus Poribacteria bacterium]